MDRTLQVLRNALVGTRVDAAHQFEAIIKQLDQQTLALFLVNYCSESSKLNHDLGKWTESLIQLEVEQEPMLDRRQVAVLIEKYEERSRALKDDQKIFAEWLKNHLHHHDIQLKKGVTLSPSSKQLRHTFQECLRRKRFLSWLVILDELERLRIIHGFTLIKLCELFFGRRVLGCFSHIQIQHHNNSIIFQTCEQLLESCIEHSKCVISDVLSDARSAMNAYASYIEFCFKNAIKSEKCLVKN